MRKVFNSPLFAGDMLEVETGRGIFFGIHDGDKCNCLTIVLDEEDMDRLRETFEEGLKGHASSDFNSPIFVGDTIKVSVNGRSLYEIYDADSDELNTIVLNEEDTLEIAKIIGAC